MKKNLLTLMLVIAFIGFGVSVASAKKPSSSGNSVAASKRLSAAKNISAKIKALKAMCQVTPCASQLQDLLDANANYEIMCGPDYMVGCAPAFEQALLYYADVYELCLWYNGHAKNIDKTKDRNKKQRSNV